MKDSLLKVWLWLVAFTIDSLYTVLSLVVGISSFIVIVILIILFTGAISIFIALIPILIIMVGIGLLSYFWYQKFKVKKRNKKYLKKLKAKNSKMH